MPRRCEILGPFSLIIQGCLGLLALSSLVFKRYHEYPNRRPWRVWFYDVSKQVFGALGVHVLNLFMSILGGQTDKWAAGNMGSKNATTSAYYYSANRKRPEDICDNPCDYYFLNILFDTTIGIPILWGLLYVVHMLAEKCGITGIDSGEYGTPPQVANYLKQLALYFVGLLSMKLIIYTLLILCPFLVKFAVWILSWTDKIPDLQVAFVMMIFPLIMNSFQYYVIDTIIQSPEYYKTNKRLKQEAENRGSTEANLETAFSADTADIEGFLGPVKVVEGEVDGKDPKEVK
ncbi:DEKNAAC103710 [Brettanomyces naardenensis]|uniref:DEKNAAC103710 n=1 Tax=Brettanomyces naardenensis TaxID=13370 RepID=A0A448YNC6_BRENA|nr:DEKNAAC103710 [Brettanomyces naardenensis]